MSKANYRTLEILDEMKKTILRRGYNNVDWDVFESWVNDIITEETEDGNKLTVDYLQNIKDCCRTAKRKNCSDDSRYSVTDIFLFDYKEIEKIYYSRDNEIDEIETTIY